MKEFAQECRVVGSGQHPLHFSCQLRRFVDGPLGEQARMHHKEFALAPVQRLTS